MGLSTNQGDRNQGHVSEGVAMCCFSVDTQQVKNGDKQGRKAHQAEGTGRGKSVEAGKQSPFPRF